MVCENTSIVIPCLPRPVGGRTDEAQRKRKAAFGENSKIRHSNIPLAPCILRRSSA